jgi:putative ABC transport system permease protein
MFGNYLVIALRNIVRHQLYSFINIGRLTVGLACAIFSALFVRDELSDDRWIPGAENLCRVETTFNNPGQPPLHSSLAPFPIPQARLQKIPEVRAMTRLMPESTVFVHARRVASANPIHALRYE